MFRIVKKEIQVHLFYLFCIFVGFRYLIFFLMILMFSMFRVTFPFVDLFSEHLNIKEKVDFKEKLFLEKKTGVFEKNYFWRKKWTFRKNHFQKKSGVFEKIITRKNGVFEKKNISREKSVFIHIGRFSRFRDFPKVFQNICSKGNLIWLTWMVISDLWWWWLVVVPLTYLKGVMHQLRVNHHLHHHPVGFEKKVKNP